MLRDRKFLPANYNGLSPLIVTRSRRRYAARLSLTGWSPKTTNTSSGNGARRLRS